MIAFSNPAHHRRQLAEAKRNGADPATCSHLASGDALSGPSFANELASANDSPARGQMTPWTKALELARSGGGSARITLNIASGEAAELRVTVRNGRVTVLVHVGSRAAESAIRAVQENIARALTESGLQLHQFFIRRPGKDSDASKLNAGRRRGLSREHNDEQEQS
jgi:hypothetical protein